MRVAGALRREAARIACSLTALLPLSGCLSPPVLLDTGHEEIELERYPAGTEFVELTADDGTVLRGVYLDAGASAPVVLVFLEAAATVAQGSRFESGYYLEGFPAPGTGGVEDPPPDFAPGAVPAEPDGKYLLTGFGCIDRLNALGASVLMVDATGVGASGGERDATHIRRDAHLAWDEAVRRAGGASSCVVLKGTSLGSLFVACLLQDGARPAAVLLVAPVRAESVVRRGGAVFYGELVAAVAAPLFADPVDADLLDAIEHSGVPVLAVVPRADVFLPPDEQRLLREAVARAGGVFLVRHLDHVSLAIAGRQLLAAERWFLIREGLVADPSARLSEELSAWRQALHGEPFARIGTRDVSADALEPGRPARLRLEALLSDVPPVGRGAAAGVALADLTGWEQTCALNELRSMPDLGLDVVAVANLCALDDPAIRMWPTTYTTRAIPMALDDAHRLQRILALVEEAEATKARIPTIQPPGDERPMLESVSDPSASMAFYRGRGLDVAAARRLLARNLMRQARLPNRIPVSDPDAAGLEVLVDGRWTFVRLNNPGGAAP